MGERNLLNLACPPTDPLAMKLTGPTTVDLVPLGERMRMLTMFRAVAVAVILVVGTLVPSARGVSLPLLAAVSLGYLAAMYAVEAWWKHSGRRARFLFGIFAMADSAFLAWASYLTGGLDSPLRYLILLQLITVSLLASFKTGLKLALFNAWLLLFAVYAQELGVLPSLGGQQFSFGDDAYRQVIVEATLFVLVAAVTTAFAAINERELRRRRFDLERLAGFSLELEQHDDPEGNARCLLDGIAGVYDAEPSLVIRRDDDGMVRVLAGRGIETPEAAKASRRGDVTPEEAAPVLAKAMADDTTLLVGRAGQKDDLLLQRFGPSANVAIVPLRGDHGSVVGALIAEHPARRGSRIERRVLTMIENFASHGSLAIENAFLLAEVKALAITDALTGVANRRHLDNFLDKSCAQVARGQGTLGLMMIDIDHFKRLNDTHGHQAGDDVLKLVAKMLDRDLRAGDLAARYGGEEFSVVLPGAHGPEVVAAAERIREAVTQIEHELSVTVSIGVSWAPHHGVTRESLTKAADAALYRAKEGGRNRVEVASPPLTSLSAKVG